MWRKTGKVWNTWRNYSVSLIVEAKALSSPIPKFKAEDCIKKERLTRKGEQIDLIYVYIAQETLRKGDPKKQENYFLCRVDTAVVWKKMVP